MIKYVTRISKEKLLEKYVKLFTAYQEISKKVKKKIIKSFEDVKKGDVILIKLKEKVIILDKALGSDFDKLKKYDTNGVMEETLINSNYYSINGFSKLKLVAVENSKKETSVYIYDEDGYFIYE